MELKDLETQITGIRDESKQLMSELKTAVLAEIEQIKKNGVADPETKSLIDNLTVRLDAIDAELKRPDRGHTAPAEPDTVAKQLFDNEEFKFFVKGLDGKKAVQQHSRLGLSFKSLWIPVQPIETKTTITETALGWATPGVLPYQRLAGIVPAARRSLRIRDLLTSRTTDQISGVEFLKENAFTSAASPQTEASAKGESALTFTIAYEKIHTIAHWIPISRQALDDLAELRAFVNDTMLYGLKLKEETEILSGDNLGDHLNGLVTQATAYAGTYAVAADTKLDKLAHGITELEVANEACTGIVLNPIDYWTIRLIKEEGGGANTGSYIVADPLGGVINAPTLWGRPVVVSNSMTSGKFLLGDFSMAQIIDRENATVDLSTEYSDYFVKNLVAVRVEERLTLIVKRAGAFRYGSF